MFGYYCTAMARLSLIKPLAISMMTAVAIVDMETRNGVGLLCLVMLFKCDTYR